MWWSRAARRPGPSWYCNTSWKAWRRGFPSNFSTVKKFRSGDHPFLETFALFLYPAARADGTGPRTFQGLSTGRQAAASLLPIFKTHLYLGPPGIPAGGFGVPFPSLRNSPDRRMDGFAWPGRFMLFPNQ